MSGSQDKTPVDHEQQAFEEFMLAGKCSKNKPPSSQNRQESRPSPDLSTSSWNKSAVKEKQCERKVWANFNSFRQAVLQEWFDIEEQIVQIIDGISNIQHRIPMETQFMNACSTHKDATPSWIHFGFTNTSLCQPLDSNSIRSRTIDMHDVHRTLSSDTIQHEVLLASLRSLVSSLAQCQNDLGKKLDDAYRLFEQSASWTSQDDTQPTHLSITSKKLFDTMNQAFHILSQELYKKQYYACLLLEIENKDNKDTDESIHLPWTPMERQDTYYYTSKDIPKNKIPMDQSQVKQLLNIKDDGFDSSKDEESHT